MEKLKIVITFKVSAEQKENISKVFSGKGELHFLREVPLEMQNSFISSADILISWNPVKELKNIERENLRKVRFVQLISAGYDQVNFDQFQSDCIIACNRGAYSSPMAEHIVGMILALLKNFLPKHRMMAEGKFDQLSENKSLKNSVCGIIGFGGIGKATADLLRPFGVKILALNTSGKTSGHTEFTGTLKDLDYILCNSDIIVLSIPLSDLTKDLICRRELELMKKDAIIINVARGAIINEKDLYFHLKNNPDFKAGIDAWWNEPFANGSFNLNYPFFELPNVLASPHNSAVVPGALFHGLKRATYNVINYIDNKDIFGIVDKGN